MNIGINKANIYHDEMGDMIINIKYIAKGIETVVEVSSSAKQIKEEKVKALLKAIKDVAMDIELIQDE